MDVIVQLTRLNDGSRKVIEFSEVTGMEGNTITTQTIFKFEQRGVENGKVSANLSPPASCRRLWNVWRDTALESPIVIFYPVAMGAKRRAL